MAKVKDDHWMEKAFANSKGQLRKKTKTKKGKNISEKALEKAEKSSNPKTRKQANLAATARKINRKGGK
jgi:hypothetical protein